MFDVLVMDEELEFTCGSIHTNVQDDFLLEGKLSNRSQFSHDTSPTTSAEVRAQNILHRHPKVRPKSLLCELVSRSSMQEGAVDSDNDEAIREFIFPAGSDDVETKLPGTDSSESEYSYAQEEGVMLALESLAATMNHRFDRVEKLLQVSPYMN